MTASPRAAGRRPWLKPAVFAGALVPLAVLLARAARGTLGANPIAEALNELGLTALVLLVASLACTPAREVLGWTWAIGLRRMLGLFAFFYASLHFSTYIGLDQGLRLTAVFADVTKRKFIFVGFAAFVLLAPLAATSTAASVQRLGLRPVEAPPPPRLRGGHPRRHPLLPAREEGRERARGLRRGARPALRRPGLRRTARPPAARPDGYFFSSAANSVRTSWLCAAGLTPM